MGQRSAYEPGVFCWVDLATNDVAGAKAFYGALFGWEYEDDAATAYTMARLGGDVAAGVMALPDDGPPRWRSFVAVESADDAVVRAEGAGATVVSPLQDAGAAGRTAGLRDPQGAAVCVWQAGDTPGAGRVNEPGFLCWNDLMTSDVPGAVAFYGDVFDWSLAAVEGAPGDRRSIAVGQNRNGGIAELPEGGPPMPPSWLACFAVDDVEAARGTVEAGGGRPVTDTFELPGGRFAVVLDPQGAAFGLIDGEMDP